MGRIQGSTAEGGQWVYGQSGLPQCFGKNTESNRVPAHIRYCAGRRRGIQRLCFIYDRTFAEGQKIAIL